MHRRRKVDEKSRVTPAGTSKELDVQNKWEENTNTHNSPNLKNRIHGANFKYSSSQVQVPGIYNVHGENKLNLVHKTHSV